MERPTKMLGIPGGPLAHRFDTKEEDTSEGLSDRRDEADFSDCIPISELI